MYLKTLAKMRKFVLVALALTTIAATASADLDRERVRAVHNKPAVTSFTNKELDPELPNHNAEIWELAKLASWSWPMA
jgi:hypothetical protein